MSPSRFHVFPVREIIDSRVTIPDTIHCCRVASSRHVFCVPSSKRMIHSRSPPSSARSTRPESAVGMRCGTPLDGAVAGRGPVDIARGRVISGGGVAPTLVGARFRILNMCPQLVHLTVTPPGLRRASSSSYSVPHFSQRTSIDLVAGGSTAPPPCPPGGVTLATGAGGNRHARAAERVKVEAFVKVSGDDGHQEYVFRTRDLSTGGLFLYTRVAHSYPFKIGSTLVIELYDYDESVACKVVVVRVVEHGSAESDR